MKLEPKLIELLNKRGIESEEEITEFLSDRPQKMHDPFLLPDMEEGVDLLLSAIENDETICIYGDYDCDGVTSTVILYEVLRKLTRRLNCYIPSRFGEGYGLNKPAIKKIRDKGADMIVTVDCGSVSADEVEYAKSLGMKILVTDHHTIADVQADCLLINPRKPGSQYPFPGLAGCGVAWKLAQAIVQSVGLDRRILTSLLDLVALGTVADIMPLTDENRTLVKYGLRMIRTSRRKNLAVLIREIGMEPSEITSERIAFGIAPHINSAGRIRHAYIALKLLLSKDEPQAKRYADELVECNRIRKTEQERVFETCRDIIDRKYADYDFLAVDLDQANEGITGIAAGKLKELYYKPIVILARLEDGRYKGTGRSIEGVDLYSMLNREREYFDSFGGHAAACGFTLKAGCVEKLRTDLNAQARKLRAEDPDLFVPKVEADLKLSAEDISMDLEEQFELLEPCGKDNEKPVVAFRAWTENTARMGNQGQYLRFWADPGDGRRIGCVSFRDVDQIESHVAGGGPVELTGNLQKNEFNGRVSLQMNVLAADAGRK